MNNVSHSKLAEAANTRKEHVAESVSAAAGQAVDRVLERTGSIPGGEKLAGSVHEAAERLKSRADNLRDGGSSSPGSTAVNLVKRHPVTFAAVGLVAVLLLARVLRSS